MSDEEQLERDAVREEAHASTGYQPSAREFCSKCGHVTKPFYRKCPKCEGDRNRRDVDALGTVIRQLKDSVHTDISASHEAELVRALTSYGHPDPQGFLQVIAAKREAAQSASRKVRR